jgi:hypothetical protein
MTKKRVDTTIPGNLSYDAKILALLNHCLPDSRCKIIDGICDYEANGTPPIQATPILGIILNDVITVLLRVYSLSGTVMNMKKLRCSRLGDFTIYMGNIK